MEEVSNILVFAFFLLCGGKDCELGLELEVAGEERERERERETSWYRYWTCFRVCRLWWLID